MVDVRTFRSTPSGPASTNRLIQAPAQVTEQDPQPLRTQKNLAQETVLQASPVISQTGGDRKSPAPDFGPTPTGVISAPSAPVQKTTGVSDENVRTGVSILGTAIQTVGGFTPLGAIGFGIKTAAGAAEIAAIKDKRIKREIPGLSATKGAAGVRDIVAIESRPSAEITDPDFGILGNLQTALQGPNKEVSLTDEQKAARRVSQKAQLGVLGIGGAPSVPEGVSNQALAESRAATVKQEKEAKDRAAAARSGRQGRSLGDFVSPRQARQISGAARRARNGGRGSNGGFDKGGQAGSLDTSGRNGRGIA